jgi:excisionase family DNA binding protein
MEKEMSDPEPLRSINDLCKWLDIPIKTIYRWTSDRRSGFPSYRVGRHLRFRFSEIERWLVKYRGSDGAKEFATRIK